MISLFSFAYDKIIKERRIRGGERMKDRAYVKEFEKLGFGMFVHFGLYSVVGKGEWYLFFSPNDREKYVQLPKKFKVSKNWAKGLVATAKRAGCKYITLTTRHHDGFSLYDTRGLNSYDAPHSACGRDLVKEFVDACNEGGVVPFFYHTLLDFWHPDYKNNFPAYIDYLVKSIEILCTNYGKIGGFWFDGMWDKWGEDWQEDRLYGTIRKHQPTAMIINNTGLAKLGEVGHPEIDSVTFERGETAVVDAEDRPRAGEMCQVLNDHWGYTAGDCNYKSVGTIIGNLIDCRYNNCNFLLNTGPKGNGEMNGMDKAFFGEIGKWVKKNKGFIYGVRRSAVQAENAILLEDDKYLYAVIKGVAMGGDDNVATGGGALQVRVGRDIKSARWLDNGKKIAVKNNSFTTESFSYGESYFARVARIDKE